MIINCNQLVYVLTKCSHCSITGRHSGRGLVVAPFSSTIAMVFIFTQCYIIAQCWTTTVTAEVLLLFVSKTKNWKKVVVSMQIELTPVKPRRNHEKQVTNQT